MKALKNIVLSLLVVWLTSCTQTKKEYVLENDFLSRTLSIQDDYLSTIKIENKLNGNVLNPTTKNEFKIRLSNGTDKVEGDINLTSKDFKVVNISQSQDYEGQRLEVNLFNNENHLQLTVYYELKNNKSYIHKYLKIVPQNNQITIERIDVEAIDSKTAYQPYQLNEITSRAEAHWKPGLGQPLYDTGTATFWGVEFPAATNAVVDNELDCGYLWGDTLKKGEEYISYKSVIGVADDYKYIDEAFYNYIDAVRIRPLRLQIQYNSWFDFFTEVNQENFKESVLKINDELVNKRGVKALNAYVIDDGWQDSRRPESDWSDKVWKVNDKFSPNLKATNRLLDSLHAKLGVWLSPGCFFGAQPMIEKMGNKGYERLELSMSMTGPKYMQKLEDRILELEKDGVSYFKFDGIFGHLNIRDFELKGRGTPSMPQLNVKNLKENDSILNDHRYDELKTYYLVNGTERLMDIFAKMNKVNPKVFIAITNGAYLSPWWLQYIDVVWMINAGDAAEGGSRTDELVYRDGVYYDIWKNEQTKFPMCSLFNHEPKKISTGESPKIFRDYLFMNLSRGTGFIELYLKTNLLSESDWDIVAEGLKWSEKVFPVFKNVKMHGGNPKKMEVYGYTAWNDKQGYISVHNPSNETKKYSIKLDRTTTGLKVKAAFALSSPIAGNTSNLKKIYNEGESVEFTLAPKEIRILDFIKSSN